MTVLVVAARALAMFLPPSVPLLLNEQQLPIVATRTEPAVPLVSSVSIEIGICVYWEGTTCRNF
jgi:hypothetical protein